MHRKMKDSGVEWIGQIPEHWKVSRVGLHFNIILGKMLCSLPTDETYSIEKYYCAADIDFNGIKKREYKTMWFSPYEKDIYRVSAGDLLVTEGGIGGCAIVENQQHDMYVQNSVMIVRNKLKSLNKYLKYWVESLMVRGYIDFVCNKVTIAHFTKTKLGQAPYPLISLSEQHRIAAYLDEKVAHIDNIIDKTKKTIEEYKKYKQSLITEAVTKGLNPDVKMKDSGVEWIGQIPEHWGITKVKYASAFNPNTTKEFDASQPVGYVPMDSVKNGYMKPLQATYENLSTGLVKFQEGDIVMAKVTPCFENGNIAIADSLEQKVAFGSSELFIFRNQNINRCYLFYFLQMTGFKNMCVSTMTGTGGLKRVSAYFIKNAIIPFPPQEEQSFIVKHLKDMCNSVDVLISQKQDIISNLESYKKSLIYEVVTGKYEVGK